MGCAVGDGVSGCDLRLIWLFGVVGFRLCCMFGLLGGVYDYYSFLFFSFVPFFSSARCGRGRSVFRKRVMESFMLNWRAGLGWVMMMRFIRR